MREFSKIAFRKRYDFGLNQMVQELGNTDETQTKYTIA